MKEDQSRAITPPPHPRERHSRISATFSREQNPQLPTKEIAPITNETFRTTFAQELNTAAYKMPEGTFYDQRHPHPVVFIGTGNAVKEPVLQALLSDLHGGNFTVLRVPGEETPRAIDSFTDARTKAMDSYRKAQADPEYANNPDIQEALRHKSIVFAANDVVNKEPAVIDGTLVFKAVGKPDGQTVEEKRAVVQNRFKKWAELIDTHGLTEFPYIIESTMYLHNPVTPEERDGYVTKKAGVWLTPETVKHLATDEGFAQYRKDVEEKGFDITKIAGGIDILTLNEMQTEGKNSVQGIFPDINTMQSPTAPLSPEAAKQYAQTLAVGNASVAFEFIHDYCAKFPRVSEELEKAQENIQDWQMIVIAYRQKYRRDPDLLF